MEGIKINFLNGDIYIEPTEKVTGFDTTVQNALVNIGTRQGTDRIYSSKGTAILKMQSKVKL